MNRSFRYAASLLCLSALLAAPASATLLVNLTTVELTPENHVHDITVQNGDDHPHVLQASVVVWAQGEDGTIERQPTTDLIVVPRVVTIEPNGQQIVRVLSRKPLTDAVERSYRVELEEVAPRGSGHISVAVSSSYGIYVFTVAPKATHPELTASLQRIDSAHAKLTFKNSGSMHALIGDVKIVSAGRKIFTGRPIPFVLGDGIRSALLPIADDAALSPASIAFQVNGHTHSQSL